jgi:hydrogenase-1 operon protein HyaF
MKLDIQAPCLTTNTTGMAYSILSEIAQRLQALADNNEPSSIDLRSVPLTQADREQLEELLGHGEVTARLEIAGTSHIWETAYAGVWWVRHMGSGDKIATEEIAITRIPEILLTDPHDVTLAAERMRQHLAAEPGRTDELEIHHV